MLFYPWYPAMMLALESNKVIDIRLRKIASGHVNAISESRLMVVEKFAAAFEAGAMLLQGQGSAEIVEFYRKHVAANVQRLSPSL